MLARKDALLNGPQSRPKPRRPLPATTPSCATCRAMIRTPHARLAAPSFRPATDPAAQPFARAVCGDICKSPIYRPPPPDARGFQPLSGFANADNSPAQNARRSSNPFLAYPGHQALISPGTLLAKTLSNRATVARVDPVQTAASGRASHAMAACPSSLVRSSITPPVHPARANKTQQNNTLRNKTFTTVPPLRPVAAPDFSPLPCTKARLSARFRPKSAVTNPCPRARAPVKPRQT